MIGRIVDARTRRGRRLTYAALGGRRARRSSSRRACCALTGQSEEERVAARRARRRAGDGADRGAQRRHAQRARAAAGCSTATTGSLVTAAHVVNRGERFFVDDGREASAWSASRRARTSPCCGSDGGLRGRSRWRSATPARARPCSRSASPRPRTPASPPRPPAASSPPRARAFRDPGVRRARLPRRDPHRHRARPRLLRRPARRPRRPRRRASTRPRGRPAPTDRPLQGANYAVAADRARARARDAAPRPLDRLDRRDASATRRRATSPTRGAAARPLGPGRRAGHRRRRGRACATTTTSSAIDGRPVGRARSRAGAAPPPASASGETAELDARHAGPGAAGRSTCASSCSRSVRAHELPRRRDRRRRHRRLRARRLPRRGGRVRPARASATTIAAGASGRNSGIVQHPMDPALIRSSPRRSATTATSPRYGFALPASRTGLLMLAEDEAALARRARRAARAATRSSAPEALRPGEPATARAGARPARSPACGCTPATPCRRPRPTARVRRPRRGRRRAAIRIGAAAALAPGGLAVDGAHVPAGAVVVAAGPWTPELVDPTGAWRPIVAAVGRQRRGAPGRRRRATRWRRWGSSDLVAEPGEPPPLFSLVTAGDTSSLGSTFLPDEPDAAARRAAACTRAARASCPRSPARRSRRCAPAPARCRPTGGRCWAARPDATTCSSPPATGRGASRSARRRPGSSPTSCSAASRRSRAAFDPARFA